VLGAVRRALCHVLEWCSGARRSKLDGGGSSLPHWDCGWIDDMGAVGAGAATHEHQARHSEELFRAHVYADTSYREAVRQL